MRRTKNIHFKRLGRELAMQFLFQFDMQGEFEESDLVRFFRQLDSSDAFEESREYRRGKKYASKLVNGVISNIDEIDSKIENFISADWDWSRVAAVDRGILRVAVYEMLFEEKVPPVVSINEAVELAKIFGTEKSQKFINGLLNNVKDTLGRDPRKPAK
jgi:N utilization substance protein B